MRLNPYTCYTTRAYSDKLENMADAGTKVEIAPLNCQDFSLFQVMTRVMHVLLYS